jgi:hypothetical protein
MDGVWWRCGVQVWAPACVATRAAPPRTSSRRSTASGCGAAHASTHTPNTHGMGHVGCRTRRGCALGTRAGRVCCMVRRDVRGRATPHASVCVSACRRASVHVRAHQLGQQLLHVAERVDDAVDLEKVEVAVVRDVGLDVDGGGVHAAARRRVRPVELLRVRRPLVWMGAAQIGDRRGREARVALEELRCADVLRDGPRLAQQLLGQISALAVDCVHAPCTRARGHAAMRTLSHRRRGRPRACGLRLGASQTKSSGWNSLN